ncbi:MAG: efflux RND transporter permease subunit, partial [Micrococcales bacterium]
MFRLAKLSLANRSVVSLITIIIAVFGVISLTSLRQELFPSIEVPQAAIVTTYPGASPTVVDSQVSKVVEAAVQGQDGVTSTSTTSQANISIVRVAFDYGTTTAQVNERLNSALASVSGLPAGVTPKLISGSLNDIPIIALGVSAKSGDNTALGQTIGDVAKSVLGKISGVRDITIDGVNTKRINLKLDSAKMAANGLTQQAITTALQSNGMVIAAGTITDSKGEMSIQSGTPVESLTALKNLPLTGSKTTVTGPTAAQIAAAKASGNPAALLSLTPTVATAPVVVKLGDVAKVSLVDAPVTSISRVNGKAALSISITKTPDGNSVAL